MPRKTGLDAAMTSPPTTVAACDILALRHAFALSFDTIGDVPSNYSICTDLSFPPIQHNQWKVPNEYHDQIKKTLDNMVTLGVNAPVTQATEWVSLLTFPRKPDVSSIYTSIPKTWIRQ